MTTARWLPEREHITAMRLARADQLAESFGQVAMAWSRGPDDDGALSLQQVERTAGVLDFEVSGIRPVPPIAAMYFSEAINHLRAAVDNVLFGLVEDDHAVAFTPEQARSVAMPIYSDAKGFRTKIARLTRSGLTSFGQDSTLGGRIASLQPFNDTTSKVPAVSPALARMTGQRPDLGEEHPLLLLQAYSNEDKHRTIRVAAAGALAQEEDTWPPPEAAMKPVAVGDVLGQAVVGVLKPMSVSAALLVQRPTSGSWVPPGPELDQLTAYVSETLIPILVTGIALPESLPNHIDLSDSGQTLAERLRDGGKDRALARSAAAMREAYIEAMQADFRYAPIVDDPSGGAENER